MGSVARRDIVWDAVLRALAENPSSIKFRDVEFNLDREVSDRTIQRTMSGMRELGWLRKDKESGHYWFPGPKALKYLSNYENDQVRRIEDHLADSEIPEQISLDGVASTGGGKTEQFVRGSVDQADDVDDGLIDSVVESADIPGSGEREVQRREALRRVLEYIRKHDEASPSEIKETFFGEFSGGYESPRSWWKNCIYKGLRESGVVETGGEGSRVWVWVGKS